MGSRARRRPAATIVANPGPPCGSAACLPASAGAAHRPAICAGRARMRLRDAPRSLLQSWRRVMHCGTRHPILVGAGGDAATLVSNYRKEVIAMKIVTTACLLLLASSLAAEEQQQVF